ncbi:MAG: HAMP domain-containing histidine kinase [Deltaproteobacteria bacterium]|nr:HAMP domain-containing histidine kinase [Deltaproteobacteria bacterium]
MLHDFLSSHRDEILSLCYEKLLQVSDKRSSSTEMELGLPVFYDELVEVLRVDVDSSSEVVDKLSDRIHKESAVRRGKESLRLGYTVSQVVHGYGALCQAITEFCINHREKPILAREFNRLNRCLDIAIAQAVTEFSHGERVATAADERQRLGFLAHELRNALGKAAAAHNLLQRGVVGFGGSTSHLLDEALATMKDLVDRSLSEVRLQGETIVERRRCRVVDLVGEVEVTGMFEALARSIHLHIEISPELVVDVDPHLLLSALSNLVQNAIKFCKTDGNVWVRGSLRGDRIFIDIEDECGGLPPGKIDELFKPYVQKGLDRIGMGLGLAIATRAVALNDGRLTAVDLPGKGCVFTIDLPAAGTNSTTRLGDTTAVH